MRLETFYDRAMAAAREKFGYDLTQVELAALVGIRQPSVFEWKEGRPKLEIAQELAKKTDTCVEWLYNATGPRHPWDTQVQKDMRLQELLSIWSQLSDEGKQRLLGAGVSLLQDFRTRPPAPPKKARGEKPHQSPFLPRLKSDPPDGHPAD